MINNNKNVNIILVLFVIACFFTNISQLPYFIQNEVARFISIPLWSLIVVVCVYKGLVRFNTKILLPIVLSVSLFVWVIFLSIFSNYDYINTPLLYSYEISIFMLFIGFWGSRKLGYKNINYIIASYTISAVIVAINIYFTYLIQSGLSTTEYLYGSKNSVSQIIFTALVFLFVLYYPRGRKLQLVKWALISFLVMVLFLLKSRATIICIFLMVGVVGLNSNTRRKTKFVIGLIVITALVLLSNSYVYDTFVNQILFAGRDSSNFNSLSTGRIAQIVEFPSLINNNELLGIGDYYIESFPLAAWLQYGYLFGNIFIIISIWPVLWGIRSLSKKNQINLAFVILASSYWINGLFEQLAPFGPGVKCYMLWLMFGILLGNDTKKNEVKNNPVKT